MQLAQHSSGPACHDTSWPIFYLKIGNSCEMEGGSIEAPWHFKLNELGPFVVDMDCEGNNLFDEIEASVHENRKKYTSRSVSPPTLSIQSFIPKTADS